MDSMYASGINWTPTTLDSRISSFYSNQFPRHQQHSYQDDLHRVSSEYYCPEQRPVQGVKILESQISPYIYPQNNPYAFGHHHSTDHEGQSVGTFFGPEPIAASSHHLHPQESDGNRQNDDDDHDKEGRSIVISETGGEEGEVEMTRQTNINDNHHSLFLSSSSCNTSTTNSNATTTAGVTNYPSMV